MTTGLVVTEFVWRHSIAHNEYTLPGASGTTIFSIRAELQPVFYQISLPWQPGPVLLKFDWHHLISCPGEPPVIGKHLGDISYTRQSKGDFVLNFVAMATGIGRGRICLTPFDSATTKTPCFMQRSPSYLLYNPSYSRFCPKFRCHGKGGWS